MQASSGQKVIPKESNSKSQSKNNSITTLKSNKLLLQNLPNFTCNVTTVKSNLLHILGVLLFKSDNMSNIKKPST